MDEIQKDNYIINFVSSKYNTNQNLSIYYRNYIGFKNSEELNKFKENFNEKDPRDNPLYKLSSSNHNPIVTITFSCILLVLDILSLIFSIILWKKEKGQIIAAMCKNLTFVIFYLCRLALCSRYFAFCLAEPEP